MFKYQFIDASLPWFTQSEIKPYYENEVACAWWDIPEFAQASTDDEDEVFRPDGKLKLINENRIFLIEITISWIDNHEKRYEEKDGKYVDILRNIKRLEPEYLVEQITLFMDSLGGYSKSLNENIGKVFTDKKMVTKIIHKMQKAVLSESVNISRCFKLSTQL